MLKNTLLYAALLVIMQSPLLAETQNPLKLLHMSFHLGCIKDFESVIRATGGVELTSWYILAADLPRTHFDGESTGNFVYNIGHDRAKKIWDLHQDYFNSFDAIITSDTAALCRIFLQNDFKKPLIIWVCNRFDYCDYDSNDCKFPDPEYFDLFKKAVTQDNVTIIAYTPYERHYAAAVRGIDFGPLCIKPCGLINGDEEKRFDDKYQSSVPQNIVKKDTLFVPPYLRPNEEAYLKQQCSALDIPIYYGRYNGPHDLKEFKGIIYFPYAWSNLALFENIQNGMVHFVPSEKFITEMVSQRMPVRAFTIQNFDLCEWYCPENSKLFVYFDSLEDLKHKIETTDYATMRAQIKEFAIEHRETMLNRWKAVFNQARNYVEKHLSLLS